MSINISIAPSYFGRLTWNISKEFTSSLSKVNYCANNVGVFLEITAIIFFLVKFFQKKSHLRTPYFVIFTIGLIFDALPKCILLCYYYISPRAFTYLLAPFQWYQGNFNAMWNMVLAMNRFTAIVCYFQYNRIWTKRKTALICGFLLLYPFLVDLYKPLKLLCQITGNYCPNATRDSFRLTYFDKMLLPTLDCVYAIFATMLCSSAIVCQIFRSKKMDVEIHQNLEKILLIQSLFSSMCLVISATFLWLANINGIEENVTERTPEAMRALYLQGALACISQLFYAVYHYSGIIAMFVLSSAFRREYLAFYKVDCVLLLFPTKKSTTIVSILKTATKDVRPVSRWSNSSITPAEIVS